MTAAAPTPASTPDAKPIPAAAVRHLRSDIVAMAGYTPGEQVRDCVKLNTNECAWGPSPAVRAVLAADPDETLRLYPDPLARKLREAAASTFDVTPDQVMAGNGSDDCLTVLYRAFLRPGDRVAAPWPTYGLYDTLAALQGVEMVHVDWRRDPVTAGPTATWRLPSSMAQHNAKLVILANPNNPSGTLVPVHDLRRLADAIDGVLVVDEAYVDFAAPGSTILPHLDAHPNLVVLRTFSKSHSLAGARLGLLFAHPAMVQHLTKVKDSYNVNAITQALGVAALNDRDHHRELVKKTLAARQSLATRLAAYGWTWPETHANLLLCEVGPQAGAIYRALKSQGVLVRWWDTPLLSTKLRISVGKPEWHDRLYAALDQALAGLGAAG
jgi:histidinol-phosphate aminotransferase